MVSDMPNGVKIYVATPTMYLLRWRYINILLSVTPKDPQRLNDAVNCYITGVGLGFSPSKSICVLFGKSKFSCLRWYLKGLFLPIHVSDSVKYLGVVIFRTYSHSSQRLNTARGAYDTLQRRAYVWMVCNQRPRPGFTSRPFSQYCCTEWIVFFETRKVCNR